MKYNIKKQYLERFIIWSFYLFLVFYLGSNPLVCHSESLEKILEKAQTDGLYVTPRGENLLKAEKLFSELFSSIITDKQKKEWAQLGFNLRKWENTSKKYWILSEIENQKEGRGFYIFSLKKRINRILQMPHSFKDLYTGKIGLKLAEEGDFLAIGWNTVPRYVIKKGKRKESDFSDLYDTYFAAFSKAFAKLYPQGYIIQLHGYSKSKRKSNRGLKSDIILSNGTQIPNFATKKMDMCLEQNNFPNVKTYPFEVKELGATKTSIGIIVRKMGHNGFLHVEMSKPIRLLMRDDSNTRHNFLKCINEIMP